MKRCPKCSETFNDQTSLCPHDGEALESAYSRPEDLVGTLLSGKYKLSAVLGQGGMGAVYEGEHVQLARPVAVKMIHPGFVCPESVSRFQREAKIASRLNHSNVVQIYDFGQTEDGSLYLVMEKLKGEELKARILAQGPMPPGEAIAVFRQICEGMAAAHALHMLHRDIKPQNIMLVKDARGRDLVKILDFGLAKSQEAGRTNLTEPGTVMGSPQYMSPEQINGEDLTPASDIYSLGLVFYEMLAGKPAFNGKNASEIFKAHLTEPAPFLPPSSAPAGINEIIQKCLAKTPDARHVSVEDILRALPGGEASVSVKSTMPSGAMPQRSQAPPPLPPPPPLMQIPEDRTRKVTDPDEPMVLEESPEAPSKTRPSHATPTPSRTSVVLALGLAAMLLLATAGAGVFVVTKVLKPKKADLAQDIGEVYEVAPVGASVEAETSQPEEPSSEPMAEEIPTPEDLPVEPEVAQETVTEETPEEPVVALAHDEVPPLNPQPSTLNPQGAPPSSPKPPASSLQPPASTLNPPAAPVLPALPKVFIDLQGDATAGQYIKKKLTSDLQQAGCSLLTTPEGAHIVITANMTAVSADSKPAFGAVVNIMTFSVNIDATATPWQEQVPASVLDQISFDPTYMNTKMPYEADRVTQGYVGKVVTYWKEKTAQ